jgi:ankyrin repeat protein
VVTLLLERGADPNKGDRIPGGTALHWAAAGGFCDVIGILLAAGNSPNAAASSDGTTPLHWAATSNMSAAVALLVSAGGSLQAKNKVGWLLKKPHLPPMNKPSLNVRLFCRTATRPSTS